MSRLMLFVVVVCAVVASDGRPAVAQTNDDGCLLGCPCYQPQWTITAGTVMLHRSKARAETLVLDGTTDAELANVANFDLGWAAGPQVELNRHFDRGWDIGLRYFGVDGWSASRTLADTGNLRVPLVSSDPDEYFDTAFARYTSRLYSTELNIKRQFGEHLRLLAGFRWAELHEQISAGAYSPGLEGTFDVDTANHLYGFQMGAEAALCTAGPFQLDGVLKAGVYRNSMGFNASGHGTHFELDGGATADRTSFLGEIGLTGRYRFGEHWSAYAGYELMWLDGVSLAADSVAAITQSRDDIMENGTAFYHGAQVGLEFAF